MAELTKEQKDELACTYAALILHDDNVPITSGKLSTLIKAAGVSVPAYYPSLFERVFASRNLDDILTNSAAGPSAAAPVPIASGQSTTPGDSSPSETCPHGVKKPMKKGGCSQCDKDEQDDEIDEPMNGLFDLGEDEDY